MRLDRVESLIQDVPNFPKEGILFKDITPVLEDAVALGDLVDALAELIPSDAEKLVAIESRGFILGSAVALKRGIGLVLARKPGKLPRQVISKTYDLEYGTDEIQIHADSLSKGEKVCIIDDVLATGGTARATEDVCLEAGANVLGHIFFMELNFLKGSEKLRAKATSLIQI